MDSVLEFLLWIPCWNSLLEFCSALGFQRCFLAVTSSPRPFPEPAFCPALRDDDFTIQMRISCCSPPPGAGRALGQSPHPAPPAGICPRDAGTALGSIPVLLPLISVLRSHQGPPSAALPGSRGDPFRLLHPQGRSSIQSLQIPAAEHIPALQPEPRPGSVAAGHLCCQSVRFMLN